MNTRSKNAGLLTAAGAGVLAVALVGVGLHFSTDKDSGSAGIGLAAALSAGAVSVTCPDVAGKVGTVPAAAQAGVTAELANLVKQIDNVNARLAREPGQATNQLNDLAGKRGAVIDRIILDITRVGGTAPAGLKALSDCSLADGAAAEDPAAPAETTAPADAGAGAGAGVQTVDCPTVEDQLPTVPAGAADEVTRNLALLDTQIDEADTRLAKLAVKPEGGANFINNAVIGPLEDKRFAVLNRIATAIERITKDRPAGLAELAPCTLNG